MAHAITNSVGVVSYLVLFACVGVAFVFVNLLIGRFLRPHDPHHEKLEIYECGEPTIGSSFVQFDLRFYVVALIFIIFDVEVAFLFPWATVFGKASHLMQPGVAVATPVDGQVTESAAQGLLRELGTDASITDETTIRAGAKQLLWLSVVEVLVFFSILMVGFAYVWRIGALDWIRALQQEQTLQTSPASKPSRASPAESLMSA